MSNSLYARDQASGAFKEISARSAGDGTWSLQTSGVAGFTIPRADSITQTQNATQDIWTYRFGATVVTTITITYTDATKATISTVVQT
jgi:hypothetical protein